MEQVQFEFVHACSGIVKREYSAFIDTKIMNTSGEMTFCIPEFSLANRCSMIMKVDIQFTNMNVVKSQKYMIYYK